VYFFLFNFILPKQLLPKIPRQLYIFMCIDSQKKTISEK